MGSIQQNNRKNKTNKQKTTKDNTVQLKHIIN